MEREVRPERRKLAPWKRQPGGGYRPPPDETLSTPPQDPGASVSEEDVEEPEPVSVDLREAENDRYAATLDRIMTEVVAVKGKTSEALPRSVAEDLLRAMLMNNFTVNRFDTAHIYLTAHGQLIEFAVPRDLYSSLGVGQPNTMLHAWRGLRTSRDPSTGPIPLPPQGRVEAHHVVEGED